MTFFVSFGFSTRVQAIAAWPPDRRANSTYCQGGKHLSALRLPPSLSVQKEKKKKRNLIVSNIITTRWRMVNEPCLVAGCSWVMEAHDLPSQEQGQSFVIPGQNCLTKIVFKRGLWNISRLGSLCRVGLGFWILKGLDFGLCFAWKYQTRGTGRLMKGWVSLLGDGHPPPYLGVSLSVPCFPHCKMGKPLSFLSLQTCHSGDRTVSCAAPRVMGFCFGLEHLDVNK